MAEQVADKVEAPAPATETQDAVATEPKVDANESVTKDDKTAVEAPEETAEPAKDEPKDSDDAKAATTDAPEDADKTADAKTEGDVEMADADAAEVATPAAKPAARRKSTGGDSKGKTLNRKNSKARLTHTDAKPGDQFLVKLKGFPAWPAVVCDESMLPLALLNSRPVTAAKPDGTYAENYADGGRRVNDRTFPVMYLHTNEFGWVANTVLSELSPDKARDSITDKMRKDLKAAFDLAAEGHDLDHYKDILKTFQEDLAAAAAAAATPKKSKKGKSKAADDEDIDMEDVEEEVKPKSAKKRKAEDDAATPQRADSVKKPKIKLNTSSTPKAANGAASKAKDESASKASKNRIKKTTSEKKAEPSKESKMTPEERRARKEKEVLYLRHKLQRGLLTRDQQPQEGEMKQMSDYITMLEGFVDLEVSIIRVTKINKVLKTILKLESIPREEEFHFKSRSQALLDKWNLLMASDATGSAATNGTNGNADAQAAAKVETNGVKDEVAETSNEEASKDEAKEEAKDEAKDEDMTEVEPTDASVEKTGESKEVAEEVPAANEDAEKEAEPADKIATSGEAVEAAA